MLIYLSMLETESDKALFERLYNTHYTDMYNVANGILKDHYLVEDAVHEAFIKIVHHIEKFYPERGHKTGGLCVVIVENIAKSLLRRSKMITHVPYEDYIEIPEGLSLEDMVVSYELHNELADLIMKLDSNNRIALILKAVYGYSYTEISEILDITEEAVRKRVQRGREKLKHELGKEFATIE